MKDGIGRVPAIRKMESIEPDWATMKREENHRRVRVVSLDPDTFQDDEDGASFFDRNTDPREEIVEGMFREQQLVAVAGPFGIGKSPILSDLAMHVLNGIPWCGRTVQQRPVIHVDLETPGSVYRANLQNIAARLHVPVPNVPDELDPYLELDSLDEPGTKKLWVCSSICG